jgi:hypothetical protein
MSRSRAIPSLASLFLFFAGYRAPAFAQQAPSTASSPEATIHASTNLVLVDVIALKGAGQRPDATLRREDFQIFDNRHEIPIKTFDSGAATRPLALWFVVQCTMKDWDREGSALFHGRTDLLKPALRHVNQGDTVAVAHWCDDGTSKLDVIPAAGPASSPATNIDEALAGIEQVLATTVDPPSHDRPGELALQKTLQLIVDSTHSLPHETVPVVIFLYGDYSAMPRAEADHFIDELLGTSAIAFGLRDSQSPRIHSLWGEQGAIANYIATQTGGEYLTVAPDTYAAGLEQILDQLHFRYELGFRPETLDGKRHKLLVKLTPSAASAHKELHLRHRAAYIAVPTP